MAGSTSPRHLAAASVCALLILNTGTAWGAGFAIKEQSSTAQGNSFAGATAGADDISYMFFNPAGLTRHEGLQVQSVMSIILPYSSADDARATTAGGAAIDGDEDSGNIGQLAFVPAFYSMWDPTEDLRLGLGINAPFGLVTDNPDDWVGRYHGTRSELTTINANPVVAYRVVDWFSIGAGAQIQYAKAKLESALDLGTVVGAGGGQLANDGEARVDGHDIAFGYNVGVMFEPLEGTRIGLAYRSKIDHTLEGDADFDVGNGTGAALAANPAFQDTAAKADFNAPASASIGLYHDINQEWALMGEVQWTEWSEFEELRIEFDSPQPDSVTIEDWDDSLFFAVGTTYKPEAVDGLTLRFGLAYDQSPIDEDTRTPRIPGNDRYWVSVGAGYQPFNWLDLSLSYTHIFMADGDVDLSVVDDPNNAGRGNLTASYEQHIDIVTFSGRIIF